MSFLKAIEEGKLAKKKESLQEPKKKIAKKKESSKDESFEQQYDNDPFEYTKQDLEANEKKVHAIYQAKIQELEDETKKLSRRLESQEGSYNSQIEVMQQENNLLSKKHDGLVEAIIDFREEAESFNSELKGKDELMNVTAHELEDEIETWKTRFQEMKYSKEAIQQTLEKTKSSISNKSPSEYVELLKNNQTKTELINTLHDRIFKVKHKGKNKNYNRKYAIETFRCIMEWRNLQKE